MAGVFRVLVMIQNGHMTCAGGGKWGQLLLGPW